MRLQISGLLNKLNVAWNNLNELPGFPPSV